MSTLSDLVPDVQAKLRDTPGVFWDVDTEIIPALVEAAMEATIISGEPEVGSIQFALSAGETFQSMPPGMLSILRVDGPGLIPKTTMWDMDAAIPGWQAATTQAVSRATVLTRPAAAGNGVTVLVQSSSRIQPGSVVGVGSGADFEMVEIDSVAWGAFVAVTLANNHVAGEPVYLPPIYAPQAWFPFGMAGWGVYPKVVGGANVLVTGILQPITSNAPWSGAETIPFQDEFREALSDYACHILRLKEAGAEFSGSLGTYQRALDRFGSLSRFAIRQNSLRFARGQGAPAAVSPVEVK